MSQYIFQNKVLTFQSNINDFTKDIYHEYDTKFKEKNIQSRIDELFSGGKVNTTENRAALHPKYKMNITILIKILNILRCLNLLKILYRLE